MNVIISCFPGLSLSGPLEWKAEDASLPYKSVLLASESKYFWFFFHHNASLMFPFFIRLKQKQVQNILGFKNKIILLHVQAKQTMGILIFFCITSN